MPNYDPNLNHIFNALSDQTRRAVLARLCQESLSVSELAKPFDMALPSFTQHLKVLENCGLVVSEKQGRTRTYRVVPETLGQAQHWLDEQKLIWEKRLDRLDNYLLSMKTQQGTESLSLNKKERKK